MNGDLSNGNGKSGWLKTSAAAVTVAVVTQLGFSVWWAAHLDQTTLHIIERANQIDAHVTRLDTMGGLKVNELNTRMNAAEKFIEGLTVRVERLESANAQILIIDERIKSMQIQAATLSQRIEAVSNNALVLSSRVEANASSLVQQQAQIAEFIRQRRTKVEGRQDESQEVGRQQGRHDGGSQGSQKSRRADEEVGRIGGG